MDSRFLSEQGTGIFTGNELIVKGALESGVGLITGYPGSPLAGLFDTLGNIKELLCDRGIAAQIAGNEALAAARVNGAQMDRIRAMAVMKSVGMHVAADGLALGNMAGAGAEAGGVAVVGDDTWSEGTQVPADSRFLSQHLHMPVLEPATFQEVKDWVGVAFELSQASLLYITYLVTSNQADGGGSVEVHPNQYPPLNRRRRSTLDPRTIVSDDRVIIPPATAFREVELVERRFPRLLESVRALSVNRILCPEAACPPLGFITSGLAYTYLEHGLHLLGLSGRFPILKLGVTYPVDPGIVTEFLRGLPHLCVVEEKRPFVEPQVASILAGLRQTGQARQVQLWGKQFPGARAGFPRTGGLHPSLVAELLTGLFEEIEGAPRGRVSPTTTRSPEPAPVAPDPRPLPARTPAFCPGCPHRDSASVLQKLAADLADPDYMKSRGREPMDLVFHGDIGCYSMLKYPPFTELMHNLSGMGLGGGTGAGIDPFIDNKQLVFMGDSTYFHGGMTAISDSIRHGQDLTYVILDNKTTAMTGHQPTPGVEVDILGQPTFAQDIEKALRGMAQGGDIFITRADPASRREYRDLIERVVLRPGVKIVIADKECGITYHRRERARAAAVIRETGFAPVERHININPDVCEYCLECTRRTGCSGLAIEPDTEYGPKICIDLSLCVTDGACTRVEVAGGDGTCPAFEEITVHRRRAAPVRAPVLDAGDLPEPQTSPLTEAWYTYIAGVGGMGVNVVAAVLAQAGVRQGYEVRLTNKKGLAIRTGSVNSHLSYAPRGPILSPLIPARRADLLIGLDVLEAARAVEAGSRYEVTDPARTAALLNTGKTPTSNVLAGIEDFSPSELGELIRGCTRADSFFAADLSGICERHLGNKLYANTMMLGVAYQRGMLALDLEHLEQAIRAAVRRDLDTNMKAFVMGRHLALDPSRFSAAASTPTGRELLEEKGALLRRTRGSRLAARYRGHVEEALGELDLDEATRRHFALRVYDLIQYQDLDWAREYIDTVSWIRHRDSGEFSWAATRAAIYNLPRTMIIKDEIYVAHLLTSEEKYRCDSERYDIDPARGDRVAYRHLTRPHVRLLGRDFRPGLRARDWQLRVLRRMKFLRRMFWSWWHREEREFGAWYVDLLRHFAYHDEASYRVWVQVLELPEQVRGYRAVRHPAMVAARLRAAELLCELGPAVEPMVPGGQPDATVSP